MTATEKTEQDKEAFKAELQALLRKYDAEMSAREVTRNWETWADGIDIDFKGIYTADGEVVRHYTTLELPRHIFGD